MTQDEIKKLSDKWSKALEKNTNAKSSERKVDVAKFLEACENGEIDFVRTVLESDNSLANAHKNGGYTALMGAARYGHTDVARLLIDNGADVNVVGDYGTPLTYAVGDLDDYPNMVRLLLEAGADVNLVARYSTYTALDLAKYGGLKKSIEIIRSWGGISVQPVDAKTFIKACEDNDIDSVIDALKTDSSLVNATSTDRYDNSALMIATSKGYTEIVKLLIANGANVNKRNCIGSTALHLALDAEMSGVIPHQGFVIAALLINAGADVNAKDVNGSFPLSIASARGYYDIVQLLLMNGANVNANDGDFWRTTAMDMAEMGGHKNIMNLLRAYGATE